MPGQDILMIASTLDATDRVGSKDGGTSVSVTWNQLIGRAELVRDIPRYQQLYQYIYIYIGRYISTIELYMCIYWLWTDTCISTLGTHARQCQNHIQNVFILTPPDLNLMHTCIANQRAMWFFGSTGAKVRTELLIMLRGVLGNNHLYHLIINTRLTYQPMRIHKGKKEPLTKGTRSKTLGHQSLQNIWWVFNVL